MANEFIARNGITSLGNIVVSGSITTTGTVVISGSIASASFAATASSADNFLTRGTLTAQTLVVQTITSSVDFVTGSTRFGSLLANTHTFTGSISASGSINASGSLRIEAPTDVNAYIVSTGGDYDTNLYLGYADAQTETYIKRVASNLVLGTTNNDRLTLGYDGNVGIGTTSPTRPLQVSRTSGQSVIGILAATNDSADIFLGDSNNEAEAVIRFINEANTFNILNGGSTRVTVTASGSVGIGTTSPSTVFHVNGSSSRVAVITTSGALSSGYYDAFQLLAANQTGGGLSLNIGKAESTNDLAKMVYFHSSNGSTSNRLGFGFYANDGLFNILASGNVGIGTSSPSYKLDVRNDSAASVSLDPISLRFYNGSDGGSAIYFSNSVGGQSKISFGVEAIGSGTDDTYLGFSTGGNTSLSERMRIKSDGGMSMLGPFISMDGSGAASFSSPPSGLGYGLFPHSGVGLGLYSVANGISFWVGGSPTERMRVNNSGTLYIGTTSNPLPDNATPLLGILAGTSTDAVNIKHTQNGNNTFNIWQTGTSEFSAIAFYKGDSQLNRGNIRVNTSGTAYNSVSDYRLKENIVPLENGLDRLMQLKPSKFNWIETGDESEGFIAHEVQEIFPDAVTGEKDAVYSSTGNIKPQSVDYGRITPLLVKAIQELKAENDSLKLRIEALENK